MAPLEANQPDRVRDEWDRFCEDLRKRGHAFTADEAGFHLARIKRQANLFNALAIAKRQLDAASAPLSAIQKQFAKEHERTTGKRLSNSKVRAALATGSACHG